MLNIYYSFKAAISPVFWKSTFMIIFKRIYVINNESKTHLPQNYIIGSFCNDITGINYFVLTTWMLIWSNASSEVILLLANKTMYPPEVSLNNKKHVYYSFVLIEEVRLEVFKTEIFLRVFLDPVFNFKDWDV